MGLIREPLEVDFYVDPRPITKEDEIAFSNYIKADKLKQTNKQGDKRASPSGKGLGRRRTHKPTQVSK